jgi:hypothetical protein
MKAVDYVDLLEQQLGDSFAKLGLPRDFVFMQDNAPIHKAKVVMNFLGENGVDVIDHLPQSPDLNPIEHVWEKIESRLRTSPACSLDNLRSKIIQFWDEIPLDYLQKLVNSMPSRLEMVIAAQGGHTKC